PWTAISLRGRTLVGSRWLCLDRTRVVSSEKLRIASESCEVAMNCPPDWNALRRANTKWLTSESARKLSGSSQKQNTGPEAAFAASTNAQIMKHFSPSDRSANGRVRLP